LPCSNAGFTIDQLPLSSTSISFRSTAFESVGGRSYTPWTSVYISIFRLPDLKKIQLSIVRNEWHI